MSDYESDFASSVEEYSQELADDYYEEDFESDDPDQSKHIPEPTNHTLQNAHNSTVTRESSQDSIHPKKQPNYKPPAFLPVQKVPNAPSPQVPTKEVTEKPPKKDLEITMKNIPEASTNLKHSKSWKEVMDEVAQSPTKARALLKKLQKENADLRDNLKRLNEQINSVLEKNISKKKPVHSGENLHEALRNAQKQLSNYQRDRNNYSKRLQKLNKLDLKQFEKEIKEKQKKVKELEKANHKLTQKNKTVQNRNLSTPPKVREMKELLKERSDLYDKVEELRENAEKNKELLESLEDQTEDLSEKREKLQEIAHHYNAGAKTTSREFKKQQKLQKKFDVFKRELDVKTSKFESQIKTLKVTEQKLSQEVSAINRVGADTALKINEKISEIKSNREELESIIEDCKGTDLERFTKNIKLGEADHEEAEFQAIRISRSGTRRSRPSSIHSERDKPKPNFRSDSPGKPPLPKSTQEESTKELPRQVSKEPLKEPVPTFAKPKFNFKSANQEEKPKSIFEELDSKNPQNSPPTNDPNLPSFLQDTSKNNPPSKPNLSFLNEKTEPTKPDLSFLKDSQKPKETPSLKEEKPNENLPSFLRDENTKPAEKPFPSFLKDDPPQKPSFLKEEPKNQENTFPSFLKDEPPKQNNLSFLQKEPKEEPQNPFPSFLQSEPQEINPIKPNVSRRRNILNTGNSPQNQLASQPTSQVTNQLGSQFSSYTENQPKPPEPKPAPFLQNKPTPGFVDEDLQEIML